MVDPPDRILDVDVESLDEPSLRAALVAARRLQRDVETFILRIGCRADELAEAGRAAPCDEFLLGRGERRGHAVRREAARARLAASVPSLLQALGNGGPTSSQLDSLVRRLGPLTEEQRASLDLDGLLQRSTDLPADTFDAAVKRLVDEVIGSCTLEDHRAARAASELRHWFDRRTGLGHVAARLDPERYEALTTAVDQQLASMATRSDRPATKDAHLALDALFELVTADGSGPRRPHLVVVVDADTLAQGPHSRSILESSDGHELPPESIARLACDATVRRVSMSADRPFGTGRRFRTATAEQWDAMRTLYSACAWAQCDRPLSWCQMHHILEWERGGAGELDNLVPLCSTHHHAVHEGRWSIELRADRALAIRRPDGQHHAVTAPPTRRPGSSTSVRSSATARSPDAEEVSRVPA